MTRIWTDKKGTRWTVDSIPSMAQIRPGQKVPMIGETDYTIRFTGEHTSHSVAVPPAVGGYLETLSDAELEKILEEARGKRYPRA